MTAAIVEVAAATAELDTRSGAPRRVKLLPIGTIAMRDGRGPYLIRDRAHAERVVAATRAWLGSADFNFDYGHAAKRDEAAIASGWAKASSLTAESDGIYAEVEWTRAAADKITAREYRYISPLFLAAKTTGEVIQLKNAALVTIGAIDLPEVAASLQMGVKWDGDKQRALTLDELRAAAAGTPVDIQTALTPEEQQECTRLGWTFADYLTQKIRQKEEAEADRSNVAAAAQMSADEIAACAALGMSHAEYLSARAADQRAKPQAAQFESAMVAASATLIERLRAGVPAEHLLTDSEREMCRLMQWTPAWYLDQKLKAMGGEGAPSPLPSADAALSADEIAACAALGMSHHEFREAKGRDAAQMTSEERRICALTGLGEADYVAAKAKLNDGTVVGAAFDEAQRSAKADLSDAERWACQKLGMSHTDFLDAKRSDKGR